MTVVHQPDDVLIDRMIWHTAHRSTFFESAVSSGKSQLKFGRSEHGIIKKHLVEVSETVHQDGILVVILDRLVLLHHWGKFCFSHFSFKTIKISKGGI